ncbi:putative Transcription activator [Klebsormidium nitens]|uniref:Putative Transcription activator n=1 Tax=Klebsormidium nitens TaxID=105231 RepID=A0A1Y1IPP1_KLENI|nr:putative Transcription activator [Klebsormidium nitens]|eukprot:GAQ92643.1 putative Transcription activator [Klebsormidium nitens]
MQRQIDDKAKSHAEVARRLKELQELQESWRGKMLETALTTARQLLCWTSSVGSTRYWLESVAGLTEKFRKDLNIGIQQALSRAIIEILLLRSGIEKNPGPATPSPHSNLDQGEDDDRADVPIGQRGQRTAAAADGTPSSRSQGTPQEPEPQGPPRKRKRNQARGGATGAPVRRTSGRGGSAGAASGRSRRGGRRAGTSVLDGIAAEPPGMQSGIPGTSREEPETRGPAEGNEQASGEENQGSENAPDAPSGTGVPGYMSHAEQLAQANWTAAIMKVDELKPKSYKDYIRALKTYKSFGVVNNFVKGMQFFALVQDNLDGIHEQSCDVRAIPTMQQLLKAAQLNTGRKKIRTCADRQAGTESDGYTAEEKSRLCRAWLHAACPNTIFNEGDEVGPAHQHTTMRGMFLASHQFVLRGDDGRSIDLPDLYCKKFTNVGPDVPLFVGGVSYCGKTNKNGRLEYFGGFRHTNVEECAVGAVAFQLFQTFHILFPEPGSFPDFSSRAAWYNKFPLFYEDDNIFEKLEYDTQLKHFKAMFQHEQVVSSKITHAPRGSSVRHAEDNGGKEGESARLGRWIYDHFRTSYLNQLPVGAMLINAGSSDDRKAYVLKRGRARPETNYPDLATKIFPWAEEALAFVKNKNLTRPAAERDIAAQRFIELLIELRAVILQDVAELQSFEKYLGHPIIYHSIFEGEDWDKFAAEVLEGCNSPEAPPQLVNLPPEVISLLRDHQALLAGIQRDVRDCKEKERAGFKQIAELTQEVAGLRRLLQDSSTSQRFGAIPSPSSSAERTASTDADRNQPAVRRSPPTFFARPPSSSVAAATQAALRAAARAAACSERAPTDGQTPEGTAADSRAPAGAYADNRALAGRATDSRGSIGGAADSHAQAGASEDSRASDGAAADNHGPAGASADSGAPVGRPANSRASTGETADSHAQVGTSADSRTPDGRAADSHAQTKASTDSPLPDGETADTRKPDVVVPDSPTSDGALADSYAPDGGLADRCARPGAVATNGNAPERTAADSHAPTRASANSRAPDKGVADNGALAKASANGHVPDRGAADSRAPAGVSADSRATDGEAANSCAPAKASEDRHGPDRGAGDSCAAVRGATDNCRSDADATNGGTPAAAPTAHDRAPDDNAANSGASGKGPANEHAQEEGVAHDYMPEDRAAARDSVRVRSTADVLPKWASEYTMGRHYKSVAEYWQEWAHGKPGWPLPLREIEEMYGCAWRKGRANEIRYFSKFRKICVIIEDVIRKDRASQAEACK